MKLGEVQNLIISRSSDHGLYLSDGTDQVLLPQNEVTPDMEKIGRASCRERV